MIKQVIKLTNAKTPTVFNYEGSGVVVRRASDADAEISIHRETDHDKPIALKRGEGFQRWPFNRLMIEWAAQAGKWVELCVIGKDEAEADVLIPGGPEAATFETSGTADTSLTTIGDPIVINGRGGLLNVEIVNGGSGALNGFTIQIRDHASGEWYAYLADADFDSTTIAAMRFASDTGPHELASGATAHAIIDVAAADAVRFLAKAATDTAAVTIRGTLGEA